MVNELDLGKESIGKLIAKFSIPCVISMIVAALYNIVDQIFIGWSEAGAYGNAATNIVYPFTVLALGLALLIGDGAAAGFSIALGMDNRKKANKNIGNGLVMLIGLAVVLCIVGFAFRVQILKLFGADPQEELCYRYATEYFLIICGGLPFYMIGQGLNGSIRADGSPKYAMACTLAGAIANLVLDPVFIFVFGMGVQGAAIATVIGQILTFAITNLPVVIKALYANMFEVEDRNAKPPKTYVYQYVDVITKEIEILEIANSIPRNEERPSRARHGNQSI